MDYEFKEFNILDMYNELQKCNACREGMLCSEHKYQKKHEFIEKKKPLKDTTTKNKPLMNKRNARNNYGSVGTQPKPPAS